MSASDQISHIPIFAGLERRALDQLNEIIERRVIPRGTQLFEQGDKRKELIIVLKGRLHIYRLFNDEVQTLALLDETNFAVETALIDPNLQHNHNAEATVDSELLIIDGKNFQKFSKDHPDTANILLGNILQNLTERLHHANNKLVTLYATGKIASTYADLDNLIELLLKTILETIHAKKAVFATYRPLENRIIIERAIGYPADQAIQNLKLSLNDDPILGEIYRTQRDIYVTKAVFKEKPHLTTEYSSQTMLGVKVRTSGQVVGAILLGEKENNRDFNYNNQILLHIIVKQIALAIQEAELAREKTLSEEHERVYVPPL